MTHSRTAIAVFFGLCLWGIGAAYAQTPPGTQPSGTAALPPLDPNQAAGISYQRDVWPIIKRQCWGCHNESKRESELSLERVSDFRDGGQYGAGFEPGQPDESAVIGYLVGTKKPRMPKGRPPLTANQIQTIRRWILAGAKDDSDTKPTAKYEHTVPEQYPAAPPVLSLTFSPDGKQLAAACQGEVALVTLDGSAPTKRLQGESCQIHHVTFTPDGKLLIASGGAPARFGEVQFWDMASANRVGQVSQLPATVGRFETCPTSLIGTRRLTRDTLFRGAVSHDGKAFAVGGHDGGIYIMATSPEGDVRRYEHHSDWVLAVAYSANGNVLISGGRDSSVKVSDPRTGQLLRTVANPAGAVLAVGATGSLALAGGVDKTPAAFELKVALGERVFSGSGNEVSLDVPNKDFTRPFDAQPKDVLGLAVDIKGELVAFASDREARVYQLADRKLIATASGHARAVTAVAFSPDGNQLATGSFDGQVRLFEARTGKLLRAIQPVPVETAVVQATGQKP